MTGFPSLLRQPFFARSLSFCSLGRVMSLLSTWLSTEAIISSGGAALLDSLPPSLPSSPNSFPCTPSKSTVTFHGAGPGKAS